MKRAGFALRITPTTDRLTGKLTRCRACRCQFVRERAGQEVCGPDCAIAYVMQQDAKAERAAAKAVRANDKVRKEALKRRADWIAEAQTAFNAFIRARDAGQTCIDCGKPFEPAKPGGSIDAGHYLSRGSAPHLRFDERNCFAQRKNCNRPGGTTREAFRKGVEARIGIEALEALESDQRSRDWSIDDLRAIKAEYKKKLRELQA